MPSARHLDPREPCDHLSAQARASETVDETLLTHLRAAAVSLDDGIVGSGRFEPLIRALAQHDADWLARNAPDVAAGANDRAMTLLVALRARDDDARVLAAGTALAGDGLTEVVKQFALSAFSRQSTFAPLLLRVVAK